MVWCSYILCKSLDSFECSAGALCSAASQGCAQPELTSLDKLLALAPGMRITSQILQSALQLGGTQLPHRFARTATACAP